MVNWNDLFAAVDLGAALAGILANPLVVGGVTIVLGTVLAPRIIRFLQRSFGRG